MATLFRKSKEDIKAQSSEKGAAAEVEDVIPMGEAVIEAQSLAEKDGAPKKGQIIKQEPLRYAPPRPFFKKKRKIYCKSSEY